MSLDSLVLKSAPKVVADSHIRTLAPVRRFALSLFLNIHNIRI